MDTPELQRLVDQELDTAVFEGGYVDLMQRSPDEVAADLCTYSQRLEHRSPQDVSTCVQAYQAWYHEHPEGA